MPFAAAARSPSDIAAAIHVASMPSSAPPTTLMSPPAPRLVSRLSPSPNENETGPRFDASTTGRIRSRYPREPVHHEGVRLVAAPDKLRGTATAAQAAFAVCQAADAAGWWYDEVPVAD